ncbi:MAG: response regulator transcription factor [Mycobacterium sp.]
MTVEPLVNSRVSTVLIVDDHPVVAHGIERVLDRAGDFAVVAACYSGIEALDVAGKMCPDIAVVDVRLGDTDGVEVCRRLLAAVPGIRVVMLTAFDDAARLRQCLASGASGVLLKGTIDLDIAQALREVVSGKIVVDRSVARDLEAAESLLTDATPSATLRPREAEVLRLIGFGMTTKAIARELDLTVNTVRSYTQALMLKLGAHTRVQAVVTGQKMGLI